MTFGSATNDSAHPNPVVAPPATLALLKKLHALSEEQERGMGSTSLPNVPKDQFKLLVSDKFIALDEDKCQFMYQLARATGATNIVEAGTSYGVSTIYLALAAAQNAQNLGGKANVIGTEHESAKAAQAHEYWTEAGAGVSEAIDLRVGDLRETLATNMPTVDMLLLDIWTPMALPALKLCQPHMRPGAVILVDNPIRSAEGYKELWEYVRAEGSGFQSLCVPYSHGLELIVYYPPSK